MKVDTPGSRAPLRDSQGLRRRDWLRETSAALLGTSAGRMLGVGGAFLSPLLNAVDASAEPLRQPSELVGPLIAAPATGAV